MNPNGFLLLNLALAFYNVGTIWAHEVDIFRSWRFVGAAEFHQLQQVHWRKLPYWIFIPVGLSLLGSIVLIWYHPAGSSTLVIWSALACQLASHALTAVLWGPWQARLSQDPLGPRSRFLDKILSTHWIRTALINAYGFILLGWSIRTATC